MITVSASWIFNRICEEPERLKKELESQARDMFINGESSMLHLLEHFQQRFGEYNLAVKTAAEIRLQANPKIEVANDTPYIKVSVK